MRIVFLFIAIMSVVSLTDCSSYDFARRVVQQGNLLPQSKIKRLRVGMSREEAAILMGTSLLSPLFNANRWDYAYTWRRGNGPTRICTVTLYFAGNSLSRVTQRPCVARSASRAGVYYP